MKALCVFSGGLDSMLAAQLIRAQDVDVLALFFETPFFESRKAEKSARSLHLPFEVVDITSRHLDVVKNPKHGYGGHMNPCIDCHALMFKVAGELLGEKNADFVVSGEVLGQRPMSQNKRALALIASESGLGRLLVRPLSAKLLPVTIPEERGWVDRDRLMDFQGRSRKNQMELAEQFHIKDYPTPAGGCLLTEEVFSRRLKDLLSNQAHVEIREIELLKTGRHFRIGSNTKSIVGRNKKENETIQSLAGEKDILLTTTAAPGPTVLVAGEITRSELELAASITLAYSDTEGVQSAEVRATGKTSSELMAVLLKDKAEFKRYMI